ncbi:MAG: ribosome maturation factor RimM [Lachnospirales bacterium]
MASRQFEIGKIVNTQGIKGDVRCISFSDDIKRFSLLKNVEATNGKTTLSLDIESVRYHKQFVVIKFKGVDDMTAGEKLKNFVLKIDEEFALPLEEDEYYIRDLYGLEVYDENDNCIGVLEDIIFTAANDVYVVKKEGNQDVLIPAIKQCILNVDIKEKKMKVKLLKVME